MVDIGHLVAQTTPRCTCDPRTHCRCCLVQTSSQRSCRDPLEPPVACTSAGSTSPLTSRTSSSPRGLATTSYTSRQTSRDCCRRSVALSSMQRQQETLTLESRLACRTATTLTRTMCPPSRTAAPRLPHRVTAHHHGCYNPNGLYYYTNRDDYFPSRKLTPTFCGHNHAGITYQHPLAPCKISLYSPQ